MHQDLFMGNGGLNESPAGQKKGEERSKRPLRTKQYELTADKSQIRIEAFLALRSAHSKQTPFWHVVSGYSGGVTVIDGVLQKH
jgi:hypothetical protein